MVSREAEREVAEALEEEAAEEPASEQEAEEQEAAVQVPELEGAVEARPAAPESERVEAVSLAVLAWSPTV